MAEFSTNNYFCLISSNVLWKRQKRSRHYEWQKETIGNSCNKFFLLKFWAENGYYKSLLSLRGCIRSTLIFGPLWPRTAALFPTQFRDTAVWGALRVSLICGLSHPQVITSCSVWIELSRTLGSLLTRWLRIVPTCVMASSIHLVFVSTPQSTVLESPFLVSLVFFSGFLLGFFFRFSFTFSPILVL